jgi:hypothetical protein
LVRGRFLDGRQLVAVNSVFVAGHPGDEVGGFHEIRPALDNHSLTVHEFGGPFVRAIEPLPPNASLEFVDIRVIA